GGYTGSVSELTAASGYATGLNFAPSGARFASPVSLALDGSGNVFAANENNSVSELTQASGYASGLNFALPPLPPGFFDSPSLALDGSGNVFVANNDAEGGNAGSVSELTAASGYATGLNFAPAAVLAG